MRLDRTTSQELVSVDLILVFESRSFDLTKDQPISPAQWFEAYMQAKLKKSKNLKIKAWLSVRLLLWNLKLETGSSLGLLYNFVNILIF